MGNCLFPGGGTGDGNEVVKVVTSNGGIMEFNTPTTVETITDEFPGHGIFKTRDLFWKPLSHQEILSSGESYYLLPLNNNNNNGGHVSAHIGHVRSNSVPLQPLVSAPYRMSFDCQGSLKRSYTEAFSRFSKAGFWKVKLVISPEQLLEILSQEGKTQELIENVRTVAKCGNIGVSSMAFSDQWSFSSSRNASSKKDALFEL